MHNTRSIRSRSLCARSGSFLMPHKNQNLASLTSLLVCAVVLHRTASLFVCLYSIAKPHELRKTSGPPAEPLSTTQAKVLIEVTKKAELSHVDAPKTGLSEAEKDA